MSFITSLRWRRRCNGTGTSVKTSNITAAATNLLIHCYSSFCRGGTHTILMGRQRSFSPSNHLSISPRRHFGTQDEAMLRSRGHAAAEADPRVRDFGRKISGDYAKLREHYVSPKYPIVLAHGLLGFSEIKLVGNLLPAVHYWHGIRDALAANGAEVYVASVPPSHSIQDRAAKLTRDVCDIFHVSPSSASSGQESMNTVEEEEEDEGQQQQEEREEEQGVNIIAHSMGGLDARYMISNILPHLFISSSSSHEHRIRVRAKSLVTIATPHRGSYFSDHLLKAIGPVRLPRMYRAAERLGFGTGAFEQLTTSYLANKFNPSTPDDPAVRYFSFGATIGDISSSPISRRVADDDRNYNGYYYRGGPSLLSPFRVSHRVIAEKEGPNDGLVSVASSRWGDYKGTLVGVSHLDLINWSNRVKWSVDRWMGRDRSFNAIAFYLDIADMLAKEGL